QWSEVSQKALALFAFGSEMAARQGLILVDTKYEFGFDADGAIILADEIHTPDSSRYWLAESYPERFAAGAPPDALDKDFIRRWVAARCDPYTGPIPEIPQGVILQAAATYVDVYEKVTGLEFALPELSVAPLIRVRANLRKYFEKAAYRKVAFQLAFVPARGTPRHQKRVYARLWRAMHAFTGLALWLVSSAVTTEINSTECLAAAGLPAGEVKAWLQAEPGETTDFPADRERISEYWRTSARLLGRLSPKPRRNASEHAAAHAVQDPAPNPQLRFLRRDVDAVCDALTVRRSRFVRVEELVIRAAGVVPGLVPTAQEIAAEDGLIQRDKSGLEIDQGLFLSAVLGSERCGRHLCHAMLLPRPQAQAFLAQFQPDGKVKLDGASVHRAGKAAVVTQDNPRFLNAEDQTSLDGAEICVDLALLDPAAEIAVMRGAVVEHPKYKGRRVFGAGINLTHLYH